MKRSAEDLIVTAIYVLVAVGALGAAAAVIARGSFAETGLDGIFLVIVCLLFAAVFGLVGARSVRQTLLAGQEGRKAGAAAKAPGTATEAAASGQPQSKSEKVKG